MNGKPLVMPVADYIGDSDGADLRIAEPIEAVKIRLNRARSPMLFAIRYVAALREMDITLSLTWMSDSPEDSDGLCSGQPCDGQMQLRDARMQVLRELIDKETEIGRARRRALVDLLRCRGVFFDNRPFPSIEAAASAWVEAGGILMVRHDSSKPLVEASHNAAHLDGPVDGYPLRQLLQRYDATIHRKDAAEGLTAFVLREGTDCGNGWTVLETATGMEKAA